MFLRTKCSRYLLFSVILTTLLSIFSRNKVLALEIDEAIIKRLVYFNPPIHTPESGKVSIQELDCVGFIYSATQLALPSACVSGALILLKHQPISLLNSEGVSVGVLPQDQQTSSDSTLLMLQQLLQEERAMLLPYDSLVEGSGKLTASTTEVVSAHLPLLTWSEAEQRSVNDQYYLLMTNKGADNYLLQPIQLGVFAVEPELFFSITPQIDTIPKGSPVLNQYGQVVCLLSSGNQCQGMLGKNLSGSLKCQYKTPYMTCSHIEWKQCIEGHALGLCKNIAGEPCVIATLANGFSKKLKGGSLNCRNPEGCGGIFCPRDSLNDTEPVTCYGQWGLCDLGWKAVMVPIGCLEGSGNTDTVDCHCTNSCKGAGYYGLVAGVSAGTAVVAVVITLAIVAGVYKYKRRGYQPIND